MSEASAVRKGGNLSAVLLAFLLFYVPSTLALFSHGGEPRRWVLMSVVMATMYSFIFCINYFWLVPKMLVKTEKATLYIIINFFLIVTLCTIVQAAMFVVHEAPPPGKHMRGVEPTFWHYLVGYVRFLFRDGVMMVLSAGLAYAMRLSRERENFRRRELELNAEKRQIELQSLKAQLNPHFLFNTLNNIYALIGFAPERAQQALHDLSGMLRFMIYDSVSAYVPLEKEFRFISDYVELVKLRLSPSVTMNCNIPCATNQELYVAPLLFLTIVENAFKHCSPSEAGNFIDINVSIDEEALVCHVRNTYGNPSVNHNSLTKESGVGLENVKRQLNLIYPDSHTLSLSKEDGIFIAKITIALCALYKRETNELS